MKIWGMWDYFVIFARDMAQEAGIIVRNFYRMMRSGALNEYMEMEMMSAYKWRQLVDIVIREDVASVAARAAKNQQYEASFNMPQTSRDRLISEADKDKGQRISADMNHPMLKSKYKQIRAEERRSDDYSKESLDVLKIIIATCQTMLGKGISTRHIIRLGNYIRVNAKKIDYDKVNRWLRALQLQRMASLVGSVLITNFALKKEEVPFVKKIDDRAAKMMTAALANGSSGRQNGALVFFEYAPLESASLFLKGIKTRLNSIEE